MTSDKQGFAGEAVEARGSEDETPLPEERVHGWESIPEWTGGLAPDEIEALVSVKELEQVYPLLHALVGRNPRDFLVRAAVIETLVADGRGSLSSEDLDEVLYWLDEVSRQATVRALRRSGWLSFEAAEGTRITDLGRWAYDVISFLHRRLKESEILPTLAGVQYAMDIGLDPIRHLLSMRSRLIRLREDMEAARASHSEVILRDAAQKLHLALNLSKQIRAVLDRIPTGHKQARRVAHDIHDLLSRLHVVASDLQSAITEVGRQYLQLTGGLTVEQIVRALMRRSREELAALGREALLPVHVPPPLLTTDVVASAAEMQFLKERAEPEAIHWEEAPDVERCEEAMEIPQEIAAYLGELAAVARGKDEVAFKELIPRVDSGTSFLRASLASLVGEGMSGEGVTGRLGSLALDVETGDGGWPEVLEQAPVSRLTPGHFRPRGENGGQQP